MTLPTTKLYVPGTRETDTTKLIMSQQLVAGQTATNTDAITTNTANIATNTTNIATNTSGIASLVAGPLTSGNVAVQADQETATSTTLAVTPGRQQFHPSASKAWALVTQSAGTYTLSAAKYNVASITKNGTGDVTLTFTTPFSSSAYCTVASATGGNIFAVVGTRATGTIQVLIRTNAGASTDAEFTVACFGDQ